jgi:hypothetical protein
MLLEESNHENKIDKNNNHNKHNDKEKTPRLHSPPSSQHSRHYRIPPFQPP